jgi:hypothetical protein
MPPPSLVCNDALCVLCSVPQFASKEAWNNAKSGASVRQIAFIPATMALVYAKISIECLLLYVILIWSSLYGSSSNCYPIKFVFYFLQQQQFKVKGGGGGYVNDTLILIMSSPSWKLWQLYFYSSKKSSWSNRKPGKVAKKRLADILVLFQPPVVWPFRTPMQCSSAPEAVDFRDNTFSHMPLQTGIVVHIAVSNCLGREWAAAKIGVLRASHKIFNSEVRNCWNDASKFSSISSSQLTFVVFKNQLILPTILPS